MPTSTRAQGERKHRGHLRLIDEIITARVAERIAGCQCLERAFGIFRSFPMLGNFLAYQFAIDVGYSELVAYTESQFVVAGPGARDGMKKVFTDPGGYSESAIISTMAERQHDEFSRLGLPFQSLWGRPLQLIDCQNLFCEVDKYARVRHPGALGFSGRTRIKRRFTVGGALPAPFYPPKWGVSPGIEQQRTGPVRGSTSAVNKPHCGT